MTGRNSRGGADSSAILYLETDRDARRALENHTAWQDVAVDTVEDTATALDRLDSAQYAAVVVEPASLDWDSETFTTSIEEVASAVPVVLYTELTANELDDVLLSGATTLVEKHSLVESLEFLRDKLAAVDTVQDGDGPGFLDSYAVLVEAARDGIYLLDANGRYQYVNQSMADLLGYEKKTLVGMHASRVMAPGELERGQARIQEMIQTDETESGVFDMQVQRKDGEQITVGLHFSIIYEDDTYAGLVGVARDVTERIERERELERQNERLDKFASLVSHDLRNPLNVAQLQLDLARQEDDSDHLDAVAEAHDRMEELIEDLLILARQGDTVTDRERVDLATMVEDCWTTSETADATLVTDIDRSTYADTNRLKQVFENLVRNSIEHGPEGVTITIGELDDGFYVEDDGPGIPDANREAVFETGFSTSAQGTGFGLSIVEQIVEGHGWDIRLTEGNDGGARFEITGVEFVE